MKQRSELSRVLSLKDAVAVGLGAIIGAGIFVVTGVAAGVAGPAFIVGLIIAGVIASFNGLSSAQLAAVYPHSGGTYEYGYRLLSPSFGFSAGWMFLISKLSAAGVVAIGFGSYSHPLPRRAPQLSVGAVTILTVVNLFGIKESRVLNLVIVSFTLLSVVSCIQRDPGSGDKQLLLPRLVPLASWRLPPCSFRLRGMPGSLPSRRNVHRPEKTIPSAVIITILSPSLLYTAVSVVSTAWWELQRWLPALLPCRQWPTR